MFVLYPQVFIKCKHGFSRCVLSVNIGFLGFSTVMLVLVEHGCNTVGQFVKIHLPRMALL